MVRYIVFLLVLVIAIPSVMGQLTVWHPLAQVSGDGGATSIDPDGDGVINNTFVEPDDDWLVNGATVTTLKSVGIGLAVPGAPLHVNVTNEGDLAQRFTVDANGYLDIYPKLVGGRFQTIFDTINNRDIILNTGSGKVVATSGFQVNDSVLFANSSGRVGIGTDTPGGRLDIHTPAGEYGMQMRNTTGGLLGGFFNVDDDRSQLWMITRTNGSMIKLDTGGVSYVTGGLFGIGTKFPIVPLDIQVNDDNLVVINGTASPALELRSTSSTGIANIDFVNGSATYSSPDYESRISHNQNGVGYLGFYTGGSTTPTMTMTNAGLVGIGVSSSLFSVLAVSESGATLSSAKTAGFHNDVLTSGVGAVWITTDDAPASDEYFLVMDSEMDSAPDNEFLFRTDGTALADGSFTGGGADVAEWTPTTDQTLESGDVLIIDGSSEDSLTKKSDGKPYDTRLMGAVSTNPGLVAGGGEAESTHENEILVALMGRVPVKVTTEAGIIEPGDLLTTSSTPGYAMKCQSETNKQKLKCMGAILGKALAPCHAETCQIQAFVTLH